MDLRIVPLSRLEADRTMKSLDGVNFQNFRAAFHGERIHIAEREQLWALPEEERSYYLVQSYLFGINKWTPQTLLLSSFARVLSTKPNENCAGCLKMLLEQELFPRSSQKTQIQARLTEEGNGVFQTLRKLRSNVYRVNIQKWDGYYYPATITYR